MSSFTHYSGDRSFTNKVHNEIALPEIYASLGWSVFPMDPDELNKIDMEQGIDYVMVDRRRNRIYVQERFREYKYHYYSDATLRYRRDHNSDINQHRSEFYKIKADFLVYGIINASKLQIQNDTKTGSFVKYAVIDLKVLFEKIQNGQIVLDSTTGRPYVSNGKMIAAVNENKDYSSSFVAFDVEGLNSLFSRDGIILTQKGFF